MNFDSFKKVMMLKICIFHERCSIVFGIVSDIECLHIVMFTFVYCLSIVVENPIFSKNCGILKKNLDGFYSLAV